MKISCPARQEMFPKKESTSPASTTALPAASMARTIPVSVSGRAEGPARTAGRGLVSSRISRHSAFQRGVRGDAPSRPARPDMASVKNFTKQAKQMELSVMKACSSETVPMVTRPVPLTMQPLRPLRAAATIPGSRLGTTGMSWKKVRLSQSRGLMGPEASSTRRSTTRWSVRSGRATMRLLMFRSEKIAETSGSTRARLVEISSSRP